MDEGKIVTGVSVAIWGQDQKLAIFYSEAIHLVH